MKKKLLKTLKEFFDKAERKKLEHHAKLTKLLQKLQRKEIHLEDKLSTETAKGKRKRLRKELQIVQAQHAKGVETLDDLETS